MVDADKATWYLITELLKKERSPDMVGHVRTNETCPVCHKLFDHIPGLGYACKEHLTKPDTYYIDLHIGERIKIYRDKYGGLLDSYGRVNGLLEDINEEIKHHTFDITKYSRAKKKEFEVTHLMDQFEVVKLKEAAPAYRRNVKRYCGTHRNFWKDKDVRDIRKIAITGYLTHLEELISGDKNRKNVLDNFKTFMNWCCEDLELITVVPKFPVIDYQLPPIRAISRDTMEMILANHVPAEHYPIFAFLFGHPVRPGEARALKMSKIDLERNEILIDSTFSEEEYRSKRKSKKAPPVVVPIHPDMLDWLTRRKEDLKLNPDGWVFEHPTTHDHYTIQNLNKVWLKIRASAELPSYLKLYDCTRHSLATLCNAAGMPILNQKTMLGHTKISSTERYPKVEVEQIGKMLAEVITLRPPTVREVSVGKKGRHKNVINLVT